MSTKQTDKQGGTPVALQHLVIWFKTRRNSDVWQAALMAGLALAAGFAGLIIAQIVGTLCALWLVIRARTDNTEGSSGDEPR